ncbi:MAG: rhodanese-like domain-containing protein [Gammaproteobacteria bacterium]|nr:rhodanese-like domain-containing protein [Gammaproteobacteria bacterium]
MTEFAGIPQISPQECRDQLASSRPPVLLDVREDWELAIASLPAAIHISMDQVAGRVGELEKQRPIVVMCRSGARSAQVAAYLVQNGFPQVFNLDGGILAWSKQLDPSIPSY